MSRKEKNEIIYNVALEISERFKICKELAKRMVCASVMMKFLDDDPEYVGHKSAYAWAEEIWDECSDMAVA